MRDVWFQALMLTSPRMCGRALRPFSIAHRYILRALGNPYAYTDVPATVSDLLNAVAVCSRTWEQNRAALFGGRPWAQDSAWDWYWRQRLARSFETADASMRQYMADYCAVPAHDNGTAKDAKIGAPVEFHLVRVLMSAFGMSEAKAWNMPWNRAVCYLDARAEAESNDTHILSPVEEHAYDLIEQASKETDKAKAEELYAQAQAIFNALNRADNG